MLKLLNKISISARLIGSFALVVAIFIAYVIFSDFMTAEVDRIHRDKDDFIMARTEMVLDYHQSFTEMRWLLHDTFMNPEWRQNTDEATWRSNEHRLTLFYLRLLTLADEYIQSVLNDPIIPSQYNDIRVSMMTETMNLVSMVYEIFRDNFFLAGNLSFDYGIMPDYEVVAEQNLRVLRQIAVVNVAVAVETIEAMMEFLNTVSVATVIGVIALAVFLTAILAKSVAAIRTLLEKENQMHIAEESNRAKTQFLARMSHEIRTPITAVMGISEIQLRSPGMPPKVEEAFDKIHGSANMLLGIVNDILDFSKIESGKMTITNDVYEVSSMVNDATQLHMVYLDSKSIALKMHIDENLPVKLIGDELRIRQIMNNLLSNAFKYTTQGRVTLSLQCEKGQKDGIVLIISIKDTGMGMTKEQLDALRGNIDYTRFHEQKVPFITGTGLGIPIVYNLVQMMGGEIDIKSEVSEGTHVVVRIPQKTTDSEVLGLEGAKNLENFEIGTLAKLNFVPEAMPYGKVLVVDDVEENLYVAKGLLAFYELQIDTCDSGYEAIDKIESGNIYDIIFMDHTMPGMNGTEALQILRGIGYTHPIVALTANALVGQREEFMKNGFDEFVSKPIQTMRLNDILVKFIKDKQQPEVLAGVKPSLPMKRKDINSFLGSSDVQQALRRDFAKRNKSIFSEINGLLAAGDTVTAHRLTHNLKSSAGLIGENSLSKLAQEMEYFIKEGITPPAEHLQILENLLTRVLTDIDFTEEPRAISKVLDKEKAKMILDKLQPMLESHNTESLSMLDELCQVPETAELIKHIEDFDFKKAQKSLDVLKETLKIT